MARMKMREQLYIGSIATSFIAATISILIISISPGQPPYVRPILLITAFLCLFTGGCHLWLRRCRIAIAGPGLFYIVLAALTLLLFFKDGTLNDKNYEHYSPQPIITFGFALGVIIASGLVVKIWLAVLQTAALGLTIAVTVFYGHLTEIEQITFIMMVGGGIAVLGNALAWIIAWQKINQIQAQARRKHKKEKGNLRQICLTGKVRCIRYYGNNFAKFKIDTQRGVLPCRANRLLLEVAGIENNSDVLIPNYGLYQHEIKEDEMYILAKSLLLAKTKNP